MQREDSGYPRPEIELRSEVCISLAIRSAKLGPRQLICELSTRVNLNRNTQLLLLAAGSAPSCARTSEAPQPPRNRKTARSLFSADSSPTPRKSETKQPNKSV